MFWPGVLVALLLAPGCAVPQSHGTREMAQVLEAIALETDRYPRSNAHANKARVRALRAVQPPSDPEEHVQYASLLGQELLRAGDSEAAIAQFESILRDIEAAPDVFDASYLLGAQDYLALSYLRLGEQDNCVANPNAQRCLLPITAEGVHTLKRGSRAAMGLYQELLTADADDLTSLWLLNLAAMTLGIYPDSVPAQWRVPPQALEAEDDVGRFVDIAPLSGVDVMGLSGGVVMEDLTGDGALDILASSWGLRDPLRFFVNLGQGTFEDRSAHAGLDGLTGGLNMVHADYDNDGDADVLVLRGAWLAQGHPNSLLRNRGDGTFEDVTVQAGLYTLRPTQTAVWTDLDLDGDLDLFIGNESNPQAGWHDCEYYRNLGDGTFEEAAREMGLAVTGYVKAVISGDYNNDGWPDLYVSRYGDPNLLLHNVGGVAFEEVAAVAGVQEPIDSFPAWFWDVDNDGWQDLFVSGWRASAADVAAEYLGHEREDARAKLYRNNQDGTFTDVAGAFRLDRVIFAMGSNFGDLDNDGWLDFYVGTGDPNLRALIPNRMFRNDAGKRFVEVTTSGGFGHLQKGHGVAFGDIDGDGDQDVYAVMGGAFEGDLAMNVLFENPGHGNEWVTLELVGTQSNRSAIGARIRVDVVTEDGRRSIHRTVSAGGSFGASSLWQEVGLGQATAIEALEVYWPALGSVQRLERVSMRQKVRIVEEER